MKELLFEALNNANILTTALLTFVMGYWVVVLIGVLDISSLDVDVDVDADVDVDVDLGGHTEVDVDSDTGSGESISWFNNVLLFFNLQYTPLMVFLTFWIVPMWTISLMANHYLGNTGFTLSMILLVPNMIATLFVAKFGTIPVARMFKKMDEDREVTNPIGKVAEVRIPTRPGKLGQATIHDTNGNVVTVNIISANNNSIAKGAQVLVIQYNKNERAYLVETYQ